MSRARRMPRPTASPAGDVTADPVAPVHAALDRLAPERGVLGVAVSGGSDSLALLSISALWAEARGRTVIAATVDHGLRPESADEARFVAEFCTARGIAHRILAAGDLSGPGNLMARAREARYRLLGLWAREQGVATVALGHTMDDQAETVLMRLARGSGAEGLSAMSERRDHGGIAWLRLMLGLRRATLRDWLAGQGIGWVEDPTNEDARFDRVRARQTLAALEPLGIEVEGLAETASRLARQRRVLEGAMVGLADVARRWGLCGDARLDLARLREAERDTALRLVADTLMQCGGAPYRPRFRSLEPLFDALLGPDFTGATLAGCVIRPAGADLLIAREPVAVSRAVRAADGALWDRRWRLSGIPPERSWIAALSERGLKSMAAAETAGTWIPPAEWARAPRIVRLTVPALWTDHGSGERLLAVPLAAYPAGATDGPTFRRVDGARGEGLESGAPWEY